MTTEFNENSSLESNSLDFIPQLVINNVVDFLPLKDLLSLYSVSHHYHQSIARHPTAWNRALHPQSGVFASLAPPELLNSTEVHWVQQCFFEAKKQTQGTVSFLRWYDMLIEGKHQKSPIQITIYGSKIPVLKRLQKLFLSQGIFPYRDEFNNLRRVKKVTINKNKSKHDRHPREEQNIDEHQDPDPPSSSSAEESSADHVWCEINDLVTPRMYQNDPDWFSLFADVHWYLFNVHELNSLVSLETICQGVQKRRNQTWSFLIGINDSFTSDGPTVREVRRRAEYMQRQYNMVGYFEISNLHCFNDDDSDNIELDRIIMKCMRMRFGDKIDWIQVKINGRQKVNQQQKQQKKQIRKSKCIVS
eukprot:gb/GECH01008076.1/.p1 GENE.gb/GECH01008076.1/~~gb/GECH01008076.1/.p1  ORF type:complete len:361 (+),score=78.51 gb/GECH01008076.1/:1-1083(+)